MVWWEDVLRARAAPVALLVDAVDVFDAIQSEEDGFKVIQQG
jgi:hypothetical protein